MPRSKAAVSAAVLMVLAVLPLAAAPVAAQDHAANASAAQAATLSYWTKDRIANAKPRDFVRNANGTFSLAKSRRRAKPGGGGGGGGNNVLGASWNGGGAVLKLSGQGPVHDEQRRLHLQRER